MPEKPLPADPGQLVIITGMTGAGRSTAAKEFEDLGFFVVDNLPPKLLPDVVKLVDATRGSVQPIAVVVDVRSGAFFDGIYDYRHQDTTGRPTTILYLDASDDVLVRRQEASRRPHPLQGDGRLLDGLEAERVVLGTLRGLADLMIDSTAYNVHQLTRRIREHFGTPDGQRLKTTVISFGFKYGIPIDGDYVADMRFLPNPHWIPELKAQTGQDAAVAEFVRAQPGAEEFLAGYLPLLDMVAHGYLREGKRFMTIAIGCTGGKHRSVAMAEEVGARLRLQGRDVRVVHRDLGKE